MVFMEQIAISYQIFQTGRSNDYFKCPQLQGFCAHLTFPFFMMHVQVVNKTYKTNLMKLNKFVMVMFSKDTEVQPKESEVKKGPFLRFLLVFKNLVFKAEIPPPHPSKSISRCKNTE